MNSVENQIKLSVKHHNINLITFNRYDINLVEIADNRLSNISKQHLIIDQDLPFLFEIKAFIDEPTNSKKVNQNISKIRG